MPNKAPKAPKIGLPLGRRGEKGDYTGHVICDGRFLVLWSIDKKELFELYAGYDARLSTPDEPEFVELLATKVKVSPFNSLCHPGWRRKRPEEIYGRLFAGENNTNFMIIRPYSGKFGIPYIIREHEEYSVLWELGKGGYGIVYLAHDHSRSTPSTASWAAIKFTARTDKEFAHYLIRELRLHQLVGDHPHIVSVRKVDVNNQGLWLVMDYLPGGDLFSQVQNPDRDYRHRPAMVKRAFDGLVDGVLYIHSKGVYHRDIKPENILTSQDGTAFFLTDFGLATDKEWTREYGCGTTIYLAHESVNKPEDRRPINSARIDVWSLGLMLCILAFGESPWVSAQGDDKHWIMYNQSPSQYLRLRWPNITDEFLKLLLKIFTIDPEKRISVAELRQAVEAVPQFTHAISIEDLEGAGLHALAGAEEGDWRRHNTDCKCPESHLIREAAGDSSERFYSDEFAEYCTLCDAWHDSLDGIEINEIDLDIDDVVDRNLIPNRADPPPPTAVVGAVSSGISEMEPETPEVLPVPDTAAVVPAGATGRVAAAAAATPEPVAGPSGASEIPSIAKKMGKNLLAVFSLKDKKKDKGKGKGKDMGIIAVKKKDVDARHAIGVEDILGRFPGGRAKAE